MTTRNRLLLAILAGFAGLLVALPSRAAPTTEIVVDVAINAEFPYRFEPASVTVPVGAVLRWTTSGAAPHTVTADGCMLPGYGPCTFDSGVEQETWVRGGTPITTFERAFDQPGVYRYLCRLHGQPGGLGQVGTVLVQAAGEPPPAVSSTAPISVNAGVEILAPAEGQAIAGDQVEVALRVTGAGVRPAASGTIDPRFGHYHLLLDVSHPLQEEFPPRRAGLFHVFEDRFTLPEVPPGAHTLTVVWGFDNHNPPQPPIMATVHFTTVAKTATEPPVALPAAGAGPPVDHGPTPALIALGGALVVVTGWVLGRCTRGRGGARQRDRAQRSPPASTAARPAGVARPASKRSDTTKRRADLRRFTVLRHPLIVRFALIVLLAAPPLMPRPATAADGATTRVSVTSDGSQTSGGSVSNAISADGRFVAFVSGDPALVADDTNNTHDVCVHDRQTGATTRVSIGAAGEANQYNDAPALSGDGRFVAFASLASNLVTGDTNNTPDIFVHDRQTGATTRVSVGAAGEANGESVRPKISGDGRFVVFDSAASNLVSGDTNGVSDVFVHDRQTGATTRVSIGTSGEANSLSHRADISADGRVVAFESHASNLVAGDTNGTFDIFVHDRQTGVTTRVSVGAAGQAVGGHSSRPSISADGRVVVFDSESSNLVAGDRNRLADVFVHDRQTGATRSVSIGANGRSWIAGVSGNGRFVVFQSEASNLVAGDTNVADDIFVHDRQTGVTTRVSVGIAGQASSVSMFPAISGDGRYISFLSWAENLVIGDTNDAPDIFVHDQFPATTPADTVAPTTAAPALSPVVNAAGWNSTNMTVSLTATDNAGGSGVREITYSADGAQLIARTTVPGASAQVAITAEGQTTLTYAATDQAGNAETAKTLTVKLDKTAPAITAAATAGGGAYTSGAWTNQAVTVTFSCTDATSGVANASGPATVGAEGASQSASGTCTDIAGNTATASFAGINVDTTKPSVQITTPTDGASYQRGASLAAAYSCSDAHAGVAACAGPVASGSPVNTATTGTATFAVTATDHAGNTTTKTVTYTVVNPAPAAGGISPTGVKKGSADLIVTVTGSGFVAESKVRWNGVDLATTFVSTTELKATVPAANLAATGVGYVSVVTAAPGGGTSERLALFITDTGAAVTEAATASSTSATGTATATTGAADGVTATATGNGTVTVAQYATNPGGRPAFTASNAYVDVFVAAGSTFTRLEIRNCAMGGGNVVYWWNGTAWVAASDQTYDAAGKCVTVVVTSATTPSLAQLTGTPFAAGTLAVGDLCKLTTEYLRSNAPTQQPPDPARVAAFCAALDKAAAGATPAQKAAAVDAYIRLVQEAQVRRLLTAQQAALLIKLARLL